MPLSNIDTTRVLMKPGALYEFKIVKAECATNEARTFKIELEALSDVEGKEPNTSVPQTRAKLFDNINTEPTGKLLQSKDPWEMIRLKAAQFTQCFCPSAGLRDLRERPQDFQGMIGTVRIGYEGEGIKADGVWRPAKNTVAEYIKKKASI